VGAELILRDGIAVREILEESFLPVSAGERVAALYAAGNSGGLAACHPETIGDRRPDQPDISTDRLAPILRRK